MLATYCSSFAILKLNDCKVTYDANGFIDKNKDTFFRDLKQILQSSKFDIVKELVPEDIKEEVITPLRVHLVLTLFG